MGFLEARAARLPAERAPQVALGFAGPFSRWIAGTVRRLRRFNIICLMRCRSRSFRFLFSKIERDRHSARTSGKGRPKPLDVTVPFDTAPHRHTYAGSTGPRRER